MWIILFIFKSRRCLKNRLGWYHVRKLDASTHRIWKQNINMNISYHKYIIHIEHIDTVVVFSQQTLDHQHRQTLPRQTVQETNSLRSLTWESETLESLRPHLSCWVSPFFLLSDPEIVANGIRGGSNIGKLRFNHWNIWKYTRMLSFMGRKYTKSEALLIDCSEGFEDRRLNFHRAQNVTNRILFKTFLERGSISMDLADSCCHEYSVIFYQVRNYRSILAAKKMLIFLLR